MEEPASAKPKPKTITPDSWWLGTKADQENPEEWMNEHVPGYKSGGPDHRLIDKLTVLGDGTVQIIQTVIHRIKPKYPFVCDSLFEPKAT